MAIRFIQDISEIVGRNNGTHTFSNDEVVDGINIQKEMYRSRWLIFDKVVFKNTVSFKDVDFQVGIKFIECKFEGSLTFYNVCAQGSDLAFEPENKNIIFSKCDFKQRIEIIGDNNSIENDVYFHECSIKRDILLQAIQSKRGGLQLDNCKVEENLTAQRNSFPQNIRLTNCSINGKAYFDENKCQSFEMILSAFTDVFDCRKNYFSLGFSFFGSEFSSSVILRDNNSHGTLNIDESVYKKDFTVSYAHEVETTINQFNSLFISNTAFLNGFRLLGRNNFSPLPQFRRINQVTIVCSTLLQGEVYFENLDISELALRGYNTQANLMFKNVFVNQLNISQFYNYAQLVLSNFRASVEPHYYSENEQHRKLRRLIIEDVNFGKAYLFDVDLNSFEDISVRDVIFTDIITSNVIWFDHEKLKIKDEKVRTKIFSRNRKIVEKFNDATMLLEELSMRRELYRHLKYAMEKNGDRPQAIEFHSIEMNYYRKLTKINKGISRADRVILWTSQSNDFGQNWVRPTILLLLFSLAFYIPLAIALSGCLRFSPAETWHQVFASSKIIFLKESWLFPQLLNPVHSTATLFGNSRPNYFVAVFFLGFFDRLFAAYFVFQIVTAFRKYVRI